MALWAFSVLCGPSSIFELVLRGLDGKMRRKDDMETLVSKKPPTDGSAHKARKGTPANHKALITRNLRLAFGEVASEPVPDRFLELLNQIDTAEAKKQ